MVLRYLDLFPWYSSQKPLWCLLQCIIVLSNEHFLTDDIHCSKYVELIPFGCRLQGYPPFGPCVAHKDGERETHGIWKKQVTYLSLRKIYNSQSYPSVAFTIPDRTFLVSAHLTKLITMGFEEMMNQCRFVSYIAYLMDLCSRFTNGMCRIWIKRR